MDLQYAIVGIIILAALIYTGSILYRKTRSFSKKASCASDCGCNGKAKKLTS